MELVLRPVGFVTSSRTEVRDDGWDAETSVVRLTDEYAPEALAGLGAFSHVEVVFLFHRVSEDRVEHGARYPRGNAAWPSVGVFAQRGKNRPNRIGTTIAAVTGVDATTVRLRGLDAVDGTPVLDLKPWMTEFGPRGEVRQPAWSHELMRGYWT